jgi:hypothetical protein
MFVSSFYSYSLGRKYHRWNARTQSHALGGLSARPQRSKPSPAVHISICSPKVRVSDSMDIPFQIVRRSWPLLQEERRSSRKACSGFCSLGKFLRKPKFARSRKNLRKTEHWMTKSSSSSMGESISMFRTVTRSIVLTRNHVLQARPFNAPYDPIWNSRCIS